MITEYSCPICNTKLDYADSVSLYQCLNADCKAIFDYDLKNKVGVFNFTSNMDPENDTYIYKISLEDFITKVKKLKAFI